MATIVSRGKIKLRDKLPEDARRDYDWQSDPELSRLDAAIPLSMTFNRYLTEYAAILYWPSPLRQQFAVDTLAGKHIGNCACYNISHEKAEAEVGIMIGDSDYWGKGYGSDAMLALVDYIFEGTELKRLHLKTLVDNHRAHKCFTRSGFTPCGQRVDGDSHFLIMEVSRQQWLERQKTGKETKRSKLTDAAKQQ